MRVSQLEVFIVERFTTEDTSTASPVSVAEIASLDHKVFYLDDGQQKPNVRPSPLNG